MPELTPEEYEAFLLAKYGIGQAGIDQIAARLLWCENRADPSPDDVEWDRADEQTRYWYQTRVQEVLDEYLGLARTSR